MYQSMLLAEVTEQRYQMLLDHAETGGPLRQPARVGRSRRRSTMEYRVQLPPEGREVPPSRRTAALRQWQAYAL